MAKELPIAQKKLMTRKRVVVISILTSALLLFVLFSSHGILSRVRIASETTDLHKIVTDAKKEEDSLRKEILNLQTDTIAIERLARERYGYIRPGEKVFVIHRDDDKKKEH